MMSLRLLADNPLRPVDWRWQRAAAILEGDRSMPASRRKDKPDGFMWINRAVKFQRELRAAQNDIQRAALAERRPDIFWAHWVWTAQNDIKHIIEAQLLAQSPDHSIGWRCNLLPGSVKAYEALFFNVRDKLQHRSYVLNSVIGPAIHRGLNEREYDLLWKLYGYFLGPCIVDALESMFTNAGWCSDPSAVGAAVMDDAVGTLKLKAALAAKTVHVNQHTQLALLEAFTKFVEIERNTDSVGKAQEQILDHISAMMTTLPFNIGGRPHRLPDLNSPIAEFERSAIELTYEETMRLSVHQPIANEQILKNLSFPVTNPSARNTES